MVVILGPRVPNAMGAPLPELWAEVWDQVAPIAEKALAGEPSRYDDLPLTMARHGEPEQTWWSFSYSPLLDEAGVIVGMFCITNETTARVLGEERLRESEGRNRQILDSAIDYAIIATDTEGRVTRWNEGARRILGWTEEEMLGEPAHRFFTPEDVAEGRVETEMRCALETGSGKDERWHIRKNGERFPCSATSSGTGITLVTALVLRSIFPSLGAPGRIFSLPGAPGSSTHRLSWPSGTIDCTQTKWSPTGSSLARALRHSFHFASG